MVVLATLLGFAIRVFRLGNPKLWLDELTTYSYAHEPWSRLLGPLATVDVHPPLYYALQKAWLVFGDSRTAARSLPVLLGVACIPVLFALGRRLFGARVGAIAAFLLATAPLHVHHSREMRQYSLLDLSTLVALLGLAYLLPVAGSEGGSPPLKQRSRVIAGCAYVAGSIGAFYTHNTAGLLPILAVLLVIELRRRGRISRQLFFQVLVANAIVLVAALPWLSVLSSHVRSTLSHFWIPPPTFAWVKSQFMGVYPYAKLLKPAFYGVALVGMWRARKHPNALAFVATFVVGQPVLLWLISYLRPVLIVRALLWPSQVFLLLPAIVFARLRPVSMVAASAAFAVLQMLSPAPKYPPLVEQSDFAAFADPLSTFDAGRDLLVIAPQVFETDLRHEFRTFDVREDAIGLCYADEVPLLEPLYESRRIDRADVGAAIADRRRVWITTEIQPRFPIPEGDDFESVLAAIRSRAHLVQTWSEGNTSLAL